MRHYLVEISFCGFRYHGWAKQPNVKTIQGQIERTVQFLYPKEKFKTLGCGRTDKMVSADQFYFELFINYELEVDEFQRGMNINLPQDIRCHSARVVNEKFNVINDVEWKEYQYFFCDEKCIPAMSPFINFIDRRMEEKLLKQASALFLGNQNLINFCHPSLNDGEKKERNIIVSKITHLDEKHFVVDKHNLKNVYQYKVRSKGFMRSQVRMMVGAIIKVGTGEMEISLLKEALENKINLFEQHAIIAAASGLKLAKVIYESD